MNLSGIKPTVLIIDDEQSVLNSLQRTLRDDFDILLSLSGEAALQLMIEREISVIIADQRMPNMTGVDFFQKSQKIQPDSERILITGYTDIEAVVGAINNGKIFYYIHKPWEPESVRIIVLRAAEHYRLNQENRSLMRKLQERNIDLESENIIYNKELQRRYQFNQIVGKSPAIVRVFDMMRKVIPTDATVLLQGETGTGKELVARALHYNGSRKNKPFVAQNCAALPDSLLESTLFGHVKGAFTDAVQNKKGLFELAGGGTVFLDEVADMSLAMQQRLLRVLQEKEVQPLGSEKTVSVDVRIISATHRDLLHEVKNGRFREDLYYRLNVFPILVPPLRERREDIPLLVEHFIKSKSIRIGKTISGIEPKSLAKLINFDFPGNIRELENIIERSLVLSEEGSQLSIDSLPNQPSYSLYQSECNTETTLKSLIDSIEKQYIVRTLKQFNGNISKTAKALGLSRSGLYIKMDRHGIKE